MCAGFAFCCPSLLDRCVGPVLQTDWLLLSVLCARSKRKHARAQSLTFEPDVAKYMHGQEKTLATLQQAAATIPENKSKPATAVCAVAVAAASPRSTLRLCLPAALTFQCAIAQ